MLLIGALALLLVVVLLAGGIYAYSRYRFGQVHRIGVGSVTQQAAPGKPFNVLLIGTDTRAGLTGAGAKAYGTAQQAGGNRADTMMVARIDPKTGHVGLLSIPYDYFAPISGTNGPNKISDALNGGPAQLIKTIESDLNIPISHYVEVNFSGFVNMVNALGGVKVNFPYPSKDTMSGLSVPHAGCQTLNGTQSLALVRSRFFRYYKNGYWHYDGSGAFGRIDRQHAFMQAAANRVKSSLLSNPIQLNSFVGTAVHYVTIDKGMSLSSMVSLALQLHSASGHVTAYTLPTQIVNNYGSYGDVLFPVPSLDAKVLGKFMSLGAPPPSSTTASTLPKLTSSVQVLNGNGTTGIAAKVSQALQAAGVSVAGVGNASSFSHTASIVEYAPGQGSQASALAAMVQGGATTKANSSLGSSTLDLIVGSSYAGIVKPSAASSGASTSGPSAASIATPALPSGGGGSIVQNRTPPSFDPTAC